MGADHSHGTAEMADHRGRLAVVLGITISVLVVEVVGAIISGSLALLADAGHMLTDVAGLSMALIAAALARRAASAPGGTAAPRFLPPPLRPQSSSRSARSCWSKASGGSSTRPRSPPA